jgi:hypothetical protein
MGIAFLRVFARPPAEARLTDPKNLSGKGPEPPSVGQASSRDGRLKTPSQSHEGSKGHKDVIVGL